MKLRQITKRDTANCHIKNQPTATSRISQLPHLLLKKWLNLKLCIQASRGWGVSSSNRMSKRMNIPKVE